MVHSSCSRLAILTLYLVLPLLVAIVIVSALLFAKWRGGVNEGRLWTCEQEPVQSMDKRPQKAAGWLCPAPQPYSLSPYGISHHSNTTWQRQGITNPLLPCFNSSRLSVTQWFVDSSFWITEPSGQQGTAAPHWWTPPTGHEWLQASEDWPGGISSSFSWEMFSKAYRKFRPPAGKSQTSIMQRGTDDNRGIYSSTPYTPSRFSSVLQP